ncbi:hypothetical protein DL93DRAFT_2171666 [Clavulina sp. PMI_390]|nr:hypothetical protein DL93DRAFT_2171666 [Clavulina sp. PMI_390]
MALSNEPLPLGISQPDTPSAIQVLPYELLLEIFLFDIEGCDHSRNTAHERPYYLASVCRIWNALVKGDARLWTHIHVDMCHHSLHSMDTSSRLTLYEMREKASFQLPFFIPHLETSLQQSRHQPLNVTILHAGDIRDALPFIHAIEDRIQTLRVEKRFDLRPWSLPAAFQIGPSSGGLLKHFTLIESQSTRMGNAEPMFANQQQVLTMRLQSCRSFEYSCFSAEALVEASFEMVDLDDQAADFLSSASNLRLLGWKGGEDLIENFDDFISLPSLSMLSVGCEPDSLGVTCPDTSWFSTYINAPNLIHLDFVIPYNLQEVISWLTGEDDMPVFSSVSSLRIFGTLSKFLLQSWNDGDELLDVNQDIAAGGPLPLFLASFPALTSLYITMGVLWPLNSPRNYILQSIASLLLHPPSQQTLFPKLQMVYIGFWSYFNDLWRSSLSTGYDYMIATSLVPPRRPAAFPQREGDTEVFVSNDGKPNADSKVQELNRVIIECGEILRLLPRVKIEIIARKREVEEQTFQTGLWLRALGGWDVLEEFSGRLQVMVELNEQSYR